MALWHRAGLFPAHFPIFPLSPALPSFSPILNKHTFLTSSATSHQAGQSHVSRLCESPRHRPVAPAHSRRLVMYVGIHGRRLSAHSLFWFTSSAWNLENPCGGDTGSPQRCFWNEHHCPSPALPAVSTELHCLPEWLCDSCCLAPALQTQRMRPTARHRSHPGGSPPCLPSPLPVLNTLSWSSEPWWSSTPAFEMHMLPEHRWACRAMLHQRGDGL